MNGSRRPSTEQEIGEFLALYPPRIASQAVALRKVVRRAVPSAVERLRPGWKLIGYDLPANKQGTFFAWVWPELEHVHVGWVVGILLSDPERVLHGAHLKLKKARYLTYEPGDPIDSRSVTEFTKRAAEIASMSRAERQLLNLTRAGEAAVL